MDTLPYHEAPKGREGNFTKKNEPEEGQTPSNSYEVNGFERIGSNTSINSLFDSNEYYCDAFKTNATQTAASSMISTPFLLTLKENILEVEDFNTLISKKLNFNKTIIILVGLPASGKSTISKQLCSYFDQKNFKSKIYNAGDIRRRLKHNSFNSSDFFDPNNLKAKHEREVFATTSLSTLIHDLNQGNISVGFLDATNTTLERRNKIMQYIRETPTRADNVILMDIQCNDQTLINFNISGKAFNADYKGKDYNTSVRDFKERSKHYIKIYDPISEEELASYRGVASLYVQIVNGGKKFKFKDIPGSNEVDIQTENDVLTCLTDFIKNYPEREGKRYFEAVEAFYKSKNNSSSNFKLACDL